jgi:hypothetical protein
VGPAGVIHVRVDAAGDCAALLAALDRKGCRATVKARMTRDPCDAIATPPAARWRSVDGDALGRVEWQAAEVDFARQGLGRRRGRRARGGGALARARQRQTRASVERPRLHRAGVLTDDAFSDANEVARRYDARAGIEPLIGEWKEAWGIGPVPSRGFDANHATLLLKSLAHDLLRRHVLRAAPALQRWRAPWLRRALAAVPGRLVRSGRCWTPRRAPRPMLN